MQRLELGAHYIMVVIPAGISCDRPARRASAVVESHYNCTHRSRNRQPGIEAFLRSAYEISHLAGKAPFDPVPKRSGCFRRTERCDADQVETEPKRLSFYKLLNRNDFSSDHGHSGLVAQRA